MIIAMELLEIDSQLSLFALVLINIAFISGVIILTTWLIRTRLGRRALIATDARTNNMPFYFPFIPLLLWFLVIWLTMSLSKIFLPNLPEWKSAFLDNLSLCIGAVIAITVIIYMAGKTFAGKLKGFGLNITTVRRDLFWAVSNLLSVWPLVTFALIVTVLAGKLIFGPEFKIEQHAELEFIMAYPQRSLRMIIFVAAVLVAPVFEEMLFRGMFQSMLRSYLAGPWAAIAISSTLFATIHGNVAHWPALFVLGGCMGYSYEKSGSLLRPIFIHCLFNAASIITALYSG